MIDGILKNANDLTTLLSTATYEAYVPPEVQESLDLANVIASQLSELQTSLEEAVDGVTTLIN